MYVVEGEGFRSQEDVFALVTPGIAPTEIGQIGVPQAYQLASGMRPLSIGRQRIMDVEGEHVSVLELADDPHHVFAYAMDYVSVSQTPSQQADTTAYKVPRLVAGLAFSETKETYIPNRSEENAWGLLYGSIQRHQHPEEIEFHQALRLHTDAYQQLATDKPQLFETLDPQKVKEFSVGWVEGYHGKTGREGMTHEQLANLLLLEAAYAHVSKTYYESGRTIAKEIYETIGEAYRAALKDASPSYHGTWGKNKLSAKTVA